MGIASLAGLVLDRAQHTALATHCHRDPGFPDWLAWNKLQIQAASVFLRHNQPVEMWRLDVDDFLQWCDSMRVTPCLEALQAYADRRNGADGEALYRANDAEVSADPAAPAGS